MSNSLYQFPLEYCRTPYGPVVYLPQDAYVGRSLHEYGWYSPSEVKLLTNILAQGCKSYYNIGANIGYMSVAMAATTGLDIFAIEPQRALYDITRMNAGAASFPGQIRTYCLAFGDTNGEVSIPTFDYSAPNNYGAISSADWTSGAPVPLRRLDSWISLPVDLLQLDVEGMELSVLRGAAETLQRDKPTIFAECDRPIEGAELLRALDEDFSYDTYWAVTPLFEDPNPAGNSTNVFEACAAFNIIGVPRSRAPRPGEVWVAEHLRRASATDEIGRASTWTVLR